MVKHVYATVNVTGNWVRDGLPLPSECAVEEGGLSESKKVAGRCGSEHM